MTFPFNDDYAEYIETTVPEAQVLSDYTPRTIASEPQLTNTPQRVSLHLTADQYRKIVSSLFTGAWFVYPSEWLEVLASFWQQVEIMEICAEFIDCIENDGDVQSAIANLLNQLGYGTNTGLDAQPPQMLPASQTSQNLLPDGYTCDNDHLFGMSRYIVQQLNDGAIQLLENLELITNPVELMAQFVDNSEVTAYAGSALELTTWIQGQLIEYYNGSYDANVEDELACAIFCIIKEDCELTLDRVIEAYSTKTFGLPEDTDSITSILEWLVSTTMNISVSTVATYHYFALQALRAGSNALGFFGLRAFKNMVSIASNFTDETWITLCECVTEWCNLFDFTSGQAGFSDTYPSRPYATYLTAQGWGCEQGNISGANDNRVYIYRNFAVAFTTSQIRVKYIATAGGSGRELFIRGDNNAGTQVFFHSFGAYVNDGTEHEFTYSVPQSIYRLGAGAVTATGATPDNDAIIITEVRIIGDVGDAPTSEDC